MGKRKERKEKGRRAGEMSQPQPSNKTKWAGTEDPGEKNSPCVRIDQIYRTRANDGGGQVCWGTEGHISIRGSPRAP